MRTVKPLFFFINILLAAFSIASKGQDIIVPEKISWSPVPKMLDPDKHEPVLYFDNAVYNNSNTHLPFFQGRIKLSNANIKEVKLSLNNQFFECFNDTDLKVYPSLKNVSDSIIIHYSVATERKVPYLIYSFIPIRRNTQNGRIEKLNSFSLNISISGGSNLKSEAATNFVSESVLNKGDWFRFFVSQSGIYRITYSDLKNLGLTQPENVRIYGNGGKMLPEIYSGTVPDDPNEIPVMMVTGSDGIFNDGDYILFYAEGPVIWSYNKTTKSFAHQKHAYADKVSYFITSSQGGARITADVVPSGDANVTEVTSFDGLDYHEINENNLLKSGKAWYGESFKDQTSYNFSFSFPGLITSEPVVLESLVVGRAGVTHDFQFKQNNQLIGAVYVPSVYMDNTLTDYARTATYTSNFSASSDNVSIQVIYDKGSDITAEGWLGYIRLTCRRNLSMNASHSPLSFRDSRSAGLGYIASYAVSNASDKTLVWDVTDLNHVKQEQGNYQNSKYTFKASADGLREYLAFEPDNGYLTPEFPEESKRKIANQNLHGLKPADLVIISPSVFMDNAKELADIHLQSDNLSSFIVTPEQIYNEYSSGMPDPAAIRNFMKMFYDRAASSADMPKYLLLFGDGSYDNRVPIEESTNGNSNYIITYESENSLYPTSTFVSDDYFGLLDTNEAIVVDPLSSNSYTTGLLDIGIGRFPVQKKDQATAVVAKIKKYISQKSLGDWRNQICFIGDDEDDNIHMEQADELAGYVSQNYPYLNEEKIYLDAYLQVSTSTGQRYPDVTTAIQNQLNRGLLILNYTGHGSEAGLAHELIMRQNEDILYWKNEQYPLFVTATCEFSSFDDYQVTTAGEDVLLNPNGGGIGLLTTNRLVYSAPNFVLNQNFYKVAFVKSEDNPSFRLGDIIRKTKNLSGSDINKLNFALLGDPALALAYPKYNVVTDSINHKPVLLADTLKAYGKVCLQGHIENENGGPVQNYNGKVSTVFFDKAKKITTLANDGGTPFEFYQQDNILFRGQASVKDGHFTINFVLPRDIDYNYGNGRISYYAQDSTSDASGYLDKVITGGLTTDIKTDGTGPEIKLYMNDTLFINGGITDENPTFLARVSDENGINPGGNSIGHDITAILDNDTKNTLVLNNNFLSDLNNYTTGSVTYQFTQLKAGGHVLKFKVWDIFNNSAESQLNFTVLDGNSPAIKNVYNYPNPFSDYTHFFFEHNQISGDLDITIEIYNVSGRKVRELHTQLNSSGYTSEPIYWDGNDELGNKIFNGVYVYRIILRSDKGIVYSPTHKLIVIKQ